MATLTTASIDRFLGGLGPRFESEAARRRAGRNVGRIISAGDRAALTRLQRKLASMKEEEPLALGYLSALRDATGSALREQDRDAEVTTLVELASEPRQGWRTILEALVAGARTPGEIATRTGKNQARVSTTLGELRDEGVVEAYAPERGQDRRLRPHRLTLAGRALVERMGLTETLPDPMVVGLDVAIAFFEQLLVMRRVLTSRFEREMPASIPARQRGRVTQRLLHACGSRRLAFVEEGVALRAGDELSATLGMVTHHSLIPRGWSQLEREVEERGAQIWFIRSDRYADEWKILATRSDEEVQPVVIRSSDLEVSPPAPVGSFCIAYDDPALLRRDQAEPTTREFVAAASARFLVGGTPKPQTDDPVDGYIQMQAAA